eukprot:TRINITY_DN3109_c0_g1_i14.p1 TRINITY_DN3109_c0_g1~~TRINITY_DN3109_c0_g1_i14.p1  ORF type:complete len:102 (-),score=12.27 TRINITY_DN3109_c0_g1_i14:453-758(-)
MAETIIPKHFHEPNPPCRFKVEIKKRMSDCLRGSDVTSSLVKIVGRPHVVDTREPEKIVNLELFKVKIPFSGQPYFGHEELVFSSRRLSLLNGLVSIVLTP